MIHIGLAGPKGAGRDTVATYLHGIYRFKRISLGAPIMGPEDVRLPFWLWIIETLHRQGADHVVIPVHSDYEAEFIREHGGQIWHIQRPGFLQHERTTAKGVMPKDADRGIFNDAGVIELFKRVDELIGDLLEQQTTSDAAKTAIREETP